MPKIYLLKITLLQSTPPIFRRLLVPSNFLLSNLHKIIQTAMGWTNSHLHQFIKNDKNYTERMGMDYLWDEEDNVDYLTIEISDLLEKEMDSIIYEYDFGDGWEHEVLLEEILERDQNIIYPICVDGAMNCPPDDCGGIFGFYEMLKILKQPKHEEYKSYLMWLGGKYDPEKFDLKKVNKMLGKRNFGLK